MYVFFPARPKIYLEYFYTKIGNLETVMNLWEFIFHRVENSYTGNGAHLDKLI